MLARRVPSRYVRQSQMWPRLDMSDKNDHKTQDMSDKARCVRQNYNKSQICPTDVSDKNENKMQDIDPSIWHEAITTSKCLERLLNLLIPIIGAYIHFIQHIIQYTWKLCHIMSLTTCYLIKAMCMHVLDVCAYNLHFSGKRLSDISCGFFVIFVGQI